MALRRSFREQACEILTRHENSLLSLALTSSIDGTYERFMYPSYHSSETSSPYARGQCSVSTGGFLVKKLTAEFYEFMGVTLL
jgi:hypothetical protein